MKCSKYNIGDELQPYMLHANYMIPCISANFEKLGILVRMDATPEPGKIITRSHGEIIDGQWVEIIDEQLTTEEIANAAALSRPRFKKLFLRRAMRALGIEAQLNAMIASNDNFEADWYDCGEYVDLNDEFAASAIVAAQMTAEQINAIKLKYAEIAG